MDLSFSRYRRCALLALFGLAMAMALSSAQAQPPGRRGGGPPGGHGGPGGGPSAFIDGMISRMDANGNGALDPQEVEGRAQYFIQRVMPGADFSRPIPIDHLRKAIEKAREQFGGPPHSSGREDSRRDDRRPSSSPGKEPLKPSALGFGNEFSDFPVFGFGKDATDVLPPVKVSDEDRRRAEYAMRYLDRNRDGSLSRDELTRSRSLRDGFRSDANKDDKLSPAEVAQHYARQRGGGDSDGGRSRGQYAGPSGMGGHEYDSGSASSDEKLERSDRPTYRFRTVEERLPAGLPTWFRDRDANGDGQVMMAEYASDWTDDRVAEFGRLDANRDGVVTPDECLSPATTEVAASSEATEQQTPPAEQPPASEPQPAPAAEPAPESVSPAYLQYAKGVIGKYDKDGNGMLTAGEWSAMSSSPAAADADGNGQITQTEYARWIASQ